MPVCALHLPTGWQELSVNISGEGMSCPILPAPCPLGGESPASLLHQLPSTPPPGIASRSTHPEKAGPGVVRGEMARWGLATGLTTLAPLAMRFHPGGSLWCAQPWAQGHSPAAGTFTGLAGGEEFPGK